MNTVLSSWASPRLDLAVGDQGGALVHAAKVLSVSVLLLAGYACDRPDRRDGGVTPESATAGVKSDRATAAGRPLSRTLLGQLSPSLRRLVRGTTGRTAHGAVLVFVSAADCFTCEDLGRQLREVQHAPNARQRSFVIATEPADVDRVVGWLQRERIHYVSVIPTTPRVVLTSGDTVLTPAVLLLTDGTRIERGVAHPQRVSNTRPRSFAAELGLM